MDAEPELSAYIIVVGCIIFECTQSKQILNVYELIGSYIIMNAVLFSFGVTHMYATPFLAMLAIWLLVLLFKRQWKTFLIATESGSSTAGTWVCVAVLAASSALYLLDWGESWQQWPIPTIYGAFCGIILSALVRLR